MTAVESATPRRELTRELGLASFFGIGAGNMLGVPVFVIPALAAALLGPGAFLAYGVAFLVALTAALSVSELVTAMPETGGSYHFLDRALGPMTGTVAGLGTWLISIFKGAFAAFVFGEFLHRALGLDFRVAVLILLLALLALNLRGVRHAGAIQIVIVTVILAGLLAFTMAGLLQADPANLRPLLGSGQAAYILPTASLVVFSYVGLVKVTAVAGEVRDPDRTIHRGVLLIMGVVTLAHVAVLTVLLGVLGNEVRVDPITAILAAAERILGPAGTVLILVTGLVAFISTANTAMLFAGRYPYAMAHESLVPAPLGQVNRRFATPHVALVVSGGVMLLLALILDVETLAEVTSSFALLLFLLLHLAVLVLRRASPRWYRPSFRTPGYPWVQAVGLAGGGALVVTLTPTAQMAILLFIAGGVLWYLAYARRRTRPRGELREVVRRQRVVQALADTADRVETDRPSALLPMDDPEHARDIFHLTAWLLGGRGGFVRAVKVAGVPFQTPLSDVRTLPLALPPALAKEIARDAVEFDLGAEFVVVFAHDPVQGLVAASQRGEFGLLLLDWDSAFVRDLGRADLRRLLHHPSMNVAFFRDRGLHRRERVLLASVRGPYDELEVALAKGAAREGGLVTLLRVLAPDAPDAQEETVGEYHGKLREVLEVATESQIVRSADPAAVIVAEAEHHDLLVLRVAREPKLGGAIFGRHVDRIVRHTACSLVLTNQAEPHRRRLFRWLLHRSLG